MLQNEDKKNVDTIEITANKNPLEIPIAQKLEEMRLHGDRFTQYEEYSGNKRVSAEIREMYAG